MFFAVLFAEWALALLSLLPAQAACPSSIPDLRAGIDAGIAAYQAWEWDRFGLARADVAAMLGCLDGPLAPEDAAQIHLFVALQAGVDKDEARATEAFRALLAVNAGYVLPEDLAAPGSLLRRAFEAAAVAEPLVTRKLPGGGWIVDGQSGARALPLSRPALVQKELEAQLHTWMVAGEPLPDDLSAALVRPSRKTAAAGGESAPAEDSDRPSRKRTLVLGVASGGALALGATAMTFAVRTEERFWDSTTDSQAVTTKGQNNALYFGALASGAVGLGLGVTATITVLGR